MRKVMTLVTLLFATLVSVNAQTKPVKSTSKIKIVDAIGNVQMINATNWVGKSALGQTYLAKATTGVGMQTKFTISIDSAECCNHKSAELVIPEKFLINNVIEKNGIIKAVIMDSTTGEHWEQEVAAL